MLNSIAAGEETEMDFGDKMEMLSRMAFYWHWAVIKLLDDGTVP